MESKIFKDKYPILSLEIPKTATSLKSVDQILTYLKGKIEEHPVAAYIGVYDHTAHTRSLPDGEVAPDIQVAKLIVFCFGKQMPGTDILAVRPRSIGVCDKGASFVLNYLEPPNPEAYATMQAWVESVQNL